MRFLHTSDWHLGLTRYFLGRDAQARFAADRFDAVRRLGELARQTEAGFVVVAGDVFHTNLVDRRTVLQALEALRAVPVPVYLLPGNHDPLDAASVYRSRRFRAQTPDHVHVLDGDSVFEPVAGVEVTGAPWPNKRPGTDLVAQRAERLEPAAGTLRVLVAHGAVDTLAPDPEAPAVISTAAAAAALEAGRFHFLALGDRHSATEVERRIWYAGTPEPTGFDEERPGRALLVELEGGECRVEEHRVGRWRFHPLARELTAEADLADLRAELEALDDKPRTVLRLALSGHLPLHAKVGLDRLLDDAGELFAAVHRSTSPEELVLVPDDVDHRELNLTGYASRAFDGLLAAADGEGDDAVVARDALALLYRLVHETLGEELPGEEDPDEENPDEESPDEGASPGAGP